MLRRVLLVALVAGALGCGPALQDPLPPEKVSDCKTACAHLRSMHCALGEPSKRGKTCDDDLCPTLEANGIRFISCTIDAASCQSADVCGE